MASVPPFLQSEFFRTWQPCSRIRHSHLSDVVENVINRLFVPKNLNSQIFSSFRLLVQDNGHFKVFSKNFERMLSPFRFFAIPVSRESISSYSLQDIGNRSSAFNAQLNWLKNIGSGILNFCPPNSLEPSKVKNFFSIFFSCGALKKFWGKNSKFRFQSYVANLLVRWILKTPSQYLENCRRR